MKSLKRLQTILFAEDDKELRTFISKILTNYGLTVYEASDGQEAINLYREKGEFIDVILSDLKMPHADGREFAKYNHTNRNLPFVIYTAFADSEDALRLLSYGVFDYLTKPVQEKVLIATLKNSLLRQSLSTESPIDKELFSGNVREINISAKIDEVQQASSWIRNLLTHNVEKININKFIIYINEILMNAYEHGSLKISENKKSELIRSDQYDSFLEKLEKRITRKIKISLSILKNEVAILIEDEGQGFDFDKYLNMSDDEIVQRIELPNGRGIHMIKNFFDSIIYTSGGSKVMVVKKIDLHPSNITESPLI